MDVKNYRPISIIPVLAKAFSIVLYGRMRTKVEKHLMEEQFGFRAGRGCDDAVHILRIVVDKSAEWGEALWAATLDVEKAFDKVSHEALFDALLSTEIDASAVASLRKLYRGMVYVQVLPGMESRRFSVLRGVRQGDPLSPILFNLVMSQAMKEVEVIWQRRGYGTPVGQWITGKKLTHIAFADDVTLLAHSWLQLKRMVCMLRNSLQARGLRLHPAKCQAQTNDDGWRSRGNVPIDEGFSLYVLPVGGCLEVLGTVLPLRDVSKAEIEHRVAIGWRKFWALKRLLLNPKVSVKRRLRLFDSSVSSSVLYGSHAWTPRVDELRFLRAAQNNMIRKICGIARRPDELWHTWVQRATHRARAAARAVRARDWTVAHAQRKWAWAGHVARMSCGAWARRVTEWRDAAWTKWARNHASQPRRPSTRPWMKWEQPLCKFVADVALTAEWISLAADRTAWSSLQEEFASRFVRY